MVAVREGEKESDREKKNHVYGILKKVNYDSVMTNAINIVHKLTERKHSKRPLKMVNAFHFLFECKKKKNKIKY